MLLNGTENEKLFAKLVPIAMKDVYTSNPRTSRRLFFTMEWQDASVGMYNKKVLVMTLTDNDDPFFLYNLHLSEEDFLQVKTSQSLLIDFPSFPQHIIKYLEESLAEEKKPQPRKLLVFTINDKLGNAAAPSQFDIVETCEFKNLIHLSLKFVAATESTVKQYLTSCYRQIKEENRQLQSRLAFSEQELKNNISVSQQTLNSKEQELESLRKEFNSELMLKDKKYALELKEERDRLTSRHKEEENRLERERKETEQRLRKEIRQLESKINHLDTLNKELQDKNYKLDATIMELRSNVRSLEEETRRLKDAVQSFKKKCDNLQAEVEEKERNIHKLNKKNEDLSKELHSKEQSLITLSRDFDYELNLNNSIKTELDSLKFRLDMSEKAQKVLENEKVNLDEIIVSLQEKTKELTEKEKTKSQSILKYKKMIDEKEKTLQAVQKEMNDLKMHSATISAQVTFLNNEKSNLLIKLEELESDRKHKDDVIQWLNRQLTENSVVPQYIAPPYLVRSPSNITPPSNLVPSPSSVAQHHLAKISSSSPEIANPATAAKNAKSVRIETPSSLTRKNISTPSRSYKAATTDSAYCTTSPSYSNQATPEIIHGSHNVNSNQKDFEVDEEGFNAVFGSGNDDFKHSTAKKPSKPTKSTKQTTPKMAIKR